MGGVPDTENVIRPSNGSIANLRGQGPRDEAPWRGGCRAYCWIATRDLQPARHRAGTVRPRRFSAGPKPGRDGFSDELGGREPAVTWAPAPAFLQTFAGYAEEVRLYGYRVALCGTSHGSKSEDPANAHVETQAVA